MKTDAQIEQDVVAELRWELCAHATHIEVKVKNGVVTLLGQVSSFAERWNAQRVARYVSGVIDLVVSMQVALPAACKREDAAIQQAALDAIQATTFLPRTRVRVSVEAGWITLSGDVDSEYQKQSAAWAVRYLIGIRGLSDKIEVRPSTNPFNSNQIIKAMRDAADAASAAHTISVEVKNAEVILDGAVQSWEERELAMYSAWGIRDVKNVVNHINIVPGGEARTWL